MGENRFWEGSCASAGEQKNPEKTNAIGTSVGPNMCLRFMIFIIRDRPISNSRGGARNPFLVLPFCQRIFLGVIELIDQKKH